MQLTTTIRRLGGNDARLIGRDGFLLYMFGYMLFLSVVMRFALPALDTYLAENADLSFRLSDFFPLLIAYNGIFLGAGLVGGIFAFILLDERDNDTLKALLVTPVRVEHYLAYRVGLPAVIGFVMVIVTVLIINQALPPLHVLVLIAAGASLLAPIASLFFASVAQNRVQGLALTKFIGLAGVFVLVAWFIPEPYQWIVGLFPPFWINKAYWMALAGNPYWPLALAVGVVTQAMLIVWLARIFRRVAYDS